MHYRFVQNMYPKQLKLMKVRLLLVTFMLMDNAMNIGLWTGFYLLERRHLGSLETVIKNVSRIRRAGFSCGELDERNAWNCSWIQVNKCVIQMQKL